jgi:hypothetical protein
MADDVVAVSADLRGRIAFREAEFERAILAPCQAVRVERLLRLQGPEIKSRVAIARKAQVKRQRHAN